MAEAGREEKRLGEERGSYHKGVPAITVVVDGGGAREATNIPTMPTLGS